MDPAFGFLKGIISLILSLFLGTILCQNFMVRIQQYLASAGIILGLLLLQTTFLPFISIGGFLPDPLLLFLVIIALRRGQIEATVTGFIIGLLQDIIATKFFGLTALAKTIGGFIAGYFFNENTMEQTLSTYRYIFLTALVSVVHYGIYFLIFFQGVEGSVFASMMEMTLGMTLYTAVISVLPTFFYSRRYNISWVQ